MNDKHIFVPAPIRLGDHVENNQLGWHGVVVAHSDGRVTVRLYGDDNELTDQVWNGDVAKLMALPSLDWMLGEKSRLRSDGIAEMQSRTARPRDREAERYADRIAERLSRRQSNVGKGSWR